MHPPRLGGLLLQGIENMVQNLFFHLEQVPSDQPVMTFSLPEDLKWQAWVTIVNVSFPFLSFPKSETAEVCVILHEER